jgi:hypothetical protein
VNQNGQRLHELQLAHDQVRGSGAAATGCASACLTARMEYLFVLPAGYPLRLPAVRTREGA